MPGGHLSGYTDSWWYGVYRGNTVSPSFYRDARIMSIYEGTTGIQALDLAGRKTLGDHGEALQDLLLEIHSTAEKLSSHSDFSDLGEVLNNALTTGSEASKWLLEHASADRNVVGGASVNFMMLMGFLCGGWVMGQTLLKTAELLDAGADDAGFLQAKQVTARFYFDHFLPRTASYLMTIKSGSASMMALEASQF